MCQQNAIKDQHHMDAQDFLEFGVSLNNAEESIRLPNGRLYNLRTDSLISQLKEMPDDDDRAYLLNATEQKVQARYYLYPQEWKEQLKPLARSWYGLRKQGDDYQDFLAGLLNLEELKTGKQKTQKFHDALVEFAGSSDPHELIKALLRVQEATGQFLKGQDGKDKALAKWTTLNSVKTIWEIPKEAPKLEIAYSAAE